MDGSERRVECLGSARSRDSAPNQLNVPESVTRRIGQDKAITEENPQPPYHISWDIHEPSWLDSHAVPVFGPWWRGQDPREDGPEATSILLDPKPRIREYKDIPRDTLENRYVTKVSGELNIPSEFFDDEAFPIPIEAGFWYYFYEPGTEDHEFVSRFCLVPQPLVEYLDPGVIVRTEQTHSNMAPILHAFPSQRVRLLGVAHPMDANSAGLPEESCETLYDDSEDGDDDWEDGEDLRASDDICFELLNESELEPDERDEPLVNRHTLFLETGGRYSHRAVIDPGPLTKVQKILNGTDGLGSSVSTAVLHTTGHWQPLQATLRSGFLQNTIVYCTEEAHQRLGSRSTHNLDKKRVEIVEFADVDEIRMHDICIEPRRVSYSFAERDGIALTIKGDEREVFYVIARDGWKQWMTRAVAEADVAIIGAPLWRVDDMTPSEPYEARYLHLDSRMAAEEVSESDLEELTIKYLREELEGLETDILYTNFIHTNPIVRKKWGESLVRSEHPGRIDYLGSDIHLWMGECVQ